MGFADKFNLDPNAVNKAYNTCEDYLKLLGLEDKVGDIEKKVTDAIKLDEGITSWNAISGTIIQYIYMATDDIICGMYPKIADNVHSAVNYNDMSKNIFSISGPEYDMATTLVACTIDGEQIDREAIRRFINSGAVEELPIWAGDFINMINEQDVAKDAAAVLNDIAAAVENGHKFQYYEGKDLANLYLDEEEAAKAARAEEWGEEYKPEFIEERQNEYGQWVIDAYEDGANKLVCQRIPSTGGILLIENGLSVKGLGVGILMSDQLADIDAHLAESAYVGSQNSNKDEEEEEL